MLLGKVNRHRPDRQQDPNFPIFTNCLEELPPELGTFGLLTLAASGKQAGYAIYYWKKEIGAYVPKGVKNHKRYSLSKYELSGNQYWIAPPIKYRTK